MRRKIIPGFLILLIALPCGADGRPRAAKSRRREVALERCLRHLVEARGLNAYGDPKNVLYPGGTPLFDELTGQLTPWLSHMRRKHPELVQACRAKGP